MSFLNFIVFLYFTINGVIVFLSREETLKEKPLLKDRIPTYILQFLIGIPLVIYNNRKSN